MTINIRQAAASDAEDIGNLAREFQSYLRDHGSDTDFDWDAAKYLRDGFGDNPAFEGIVAELDSQVVAFALFHMGYDSDHGQKIVYLIDLYVSLSHRRNGIGEQLMQQLATIGKTRGAELMAWSVLKQNTAAVRFYEKLGAKYVEGMHTMWCTIEQHSVRNCA